jgi:hypothetical protein
LYDEEGKKVPKRIRKINRDVDTEIHVENYERTTLPMPCWMK